MKFESIKTALPILKNSLYFLVTGLLFASLNSVWAVGDTIAFSSMGNIYTMDTDGSNLIKLTQGSNPSWSPDGTKIVFSFGLGRFRGDVDDIFVIDANGANRLNLTKGHHKNNGLPAWSPDGTKIAFVSNRDDNNEIYVMNADGKNLRNLTLHLDSDTCPTWSPDGTKIAFERATHDDPIYCDIYVMNVDGTDLANLTQTPGVGEVDPSWKPTPFSVSSRGKLPTRWVEVKESR